MKREFGRAPKKSTLCWECANAVPENGSGCSWALDFIPVKGWTAEKDIINNTHGKEPKGVSYIVDKCPQFKRG